MFTIPDLGLRNSNLIYLNLYRICSRPHTIDEISGQDEIVSVLKPALESHNVADLFILIIM